MLSNQTLSIKPTPNLHTRDSMAEAGRKVLNFHFQRMLQNEVGTRLGEDIEALHAMRVATRRMRSAFRVFKPYYLPVAIRHHRQGLKTTGQILGVVRDWDVLLEKTQAYVDSLTPDEQSGLEVLMGSWSQAREAAREQLLTYLDSATYRDFKYAFSEFLHIPGDDLLDLRPQQWMVYETAPPLILSLYERVLAHEEELQPPNVKQLHVLRIDFKRFRYTLEFFSKVLGETADLCIEEVKNLQDHLGALNDASMAIRRIQHFLSVTDGHGQALLPVERFLHAKERELHQLLETFPSAWENFRQPDFYQNLEAALQVLRYPI